MLCAICPLALHKTPRDHADSHNVQLPISQFSATDRSKYCAASGSTKQMLLPVAPRCVEVHGLAGGVLWHNAQEGLVNYFTPPSTHHVIITI